MPGQPISTAATDSGKWYTAFANRAFIARSCKYVFLLVALVVNLKLVFDGYSFYVARRDIDAELQSKKGYSLEYLNVLSRRNRALVLVNLETRCLERMELTLFRIFESSLINQQIGKNLDEAYTRYMEKKSAITLTINRLGPGVIDVEEARKYVGSATFSAFNYDNHFKPLAEVGADSQKYKELKEQLEHDMKDYMKFGSDYVALRKAALNEIRHRTEDPAKYLIVDTALEKTLTELKDAYDKYVAKKSGIIATLYEFGVGVIDVTEAEKYVDSAAFNASGFGTYLKPLTGVRENDEKYKKLKEQAEHSLKEFSDLGFRYAALRQDAIDEIRKRTALDATNLGLIKLLEERLNRLKDERIKMQQMVGDINDVMARYGVWTAALTGGAADAPILDEMAYELGAEDAKTLTALRCDRFKQFYEAVNQKLMQADPYHGKTSWEALTARQKLTYPLQLYDQLLLTYFQQPPTAQTLLVTLLLGSLGALTLNVLRLSRVGWWARQRDPPWGEILVGPLLGALAAFAIFLVMSAGLLLSSDVRAAQNGVTPLSAFFIGLLGFLSGLLYDEAFGRVRRVGSQIFAAPADAPANARAEDIALAEALRKAGATRVAELVLKHGLGTRLAIEDAFTLLAPSDEAVGRLTLSTWTSLNNTEASDFKKWYDHHHSPQRLTKKDVIGDAAKPAVHELKASDGTVYPLAIDGNDLKIGNIRVVIADVAWNKGTIHVLNEDLG
jgi:uncharacterized surface protein with fasciclin (FAS1) repeats